MAENRKLKVVIVGSGIAGLATAIALRKHPRIEVELYDQATELKEIGASIALSPNGLRTLERLGVHNALTDWMGFRGPSGFPMIYRHWKTNEIVSVDQFSQVPERRHQTTRFHRGHLHAALLEHVPRELIHLRKRADKVNVDQNEVTVQFEDGSSATGDVLIGADGIKSKIRENFKPDHNVKWTGKTFFRATFDASLVEGIPDLPADSSHWWGPDRTFFASRLGKNQYTAVGAYDPSKVQASKAVPANEVGWNDEGSVEVFRELYKDWNHVVRAITQATPSTRLFPNFAGEPLPTWVFESRVTLVGDAAHTHGGAHAAGGSLAIDDAYALYLSFLHVWPSKGISKEFTAQEIERALTIYERTRRPHTALLQRLVLNVKAQAGDLTDEELRLKMTTRGDTEWLTLHDIEEAFTRGRSEELAKI